MWVPVLNNYNIAFHTIPKETKKFERIKTGNFGHRNNGVNRETESFHI